MPVYTTFNSDHEKEVKNSYQRIRDFRQQMNDIYLEREWLIDQILHCLITNQHLLMYGKPGSAKSAVASTLFNSITGSGINGEDPKVFEIQLTPATSLQDIFGGINLPKYEKTGLRHRNPTGKIQEAHFAIVDEFFDAPNLVRAFNDALNERVYRSEGGQKKHIPLMSAVAATNKSPDEIIKRYKHINLEAVNDRFLCVARVSYLKDEINRTDMMANFVMSRRVTAQIPFRDIQVLSQILKDTNQFPDRTFVDTARQIVDAYEQRAVADGILEHVSDRDRNWQTLIIEASAILNGRLTLHPQDLLAIGLGLCPDEGSPEHQLFVNVATPIIADASDRYTQQMDIIENQLLDGLERQVMTMERASRQNPWNPDATTIGKMLLDLKELNKQMDQMNVELSSTEKRIRELKQRISRINGHITAL